MMIRTTFLNLSPSQRISLMFKLMVKKGGILPKAGRFVLDNYFIHIRQPNDIDIQEARHEDFRSEFVEVIK